LDLRKGRKYQTAKENCIMRCFITWAFQVIKVINRSTRQDGHVARKERRYAYKLPDGETDGRYLEDIDKDGKTETYVREKGDNKSIGFD
jgi:hypothetical protein